MCIRDRSNGIIVTGFSDVESGIDAFSQQITIDGKVVYIIASVSYTHLDVYKRQVFGVLDFENLGGLAAYSFLIFNLLCAPCFDDKPLLTLYILHIRLYCPVR